MKRFILILLIPVFLGVSVWAFLEGRKEMQKEREREKPVQTPPRAKKGSNGNMIVEFDGDTLQLSGVESETINGPLPYDSIVLADGDSWYFAEKAKGTFERKACVTNTCIVSGEKVVTKGSQILLSEERKGIIHIGEEEGGK